MKISQLLENEKISQPPSPTNVDVGYTVGNVRVDNVRGLGSCPNNQDNTYRGFTAFITPSKFLKLALVDDTNRQEKFMKLVRDEGHAIGSPMFYVQILKDDGNEPSWHIENEDPDKMYFKISGHEGRGRMAGVKALNGDTPFPVQFHVRGEIRAKKIPLAMLEALVNGNPVISERNESVSLECKKIFWQGKTITD